MLWCHQILEMSPYKIWVSLSIIYVMIAKNIRYLRWNEGAWHSFHNTYQTFLNLCIRCTDDLLSDSCCLTDVNPHFIPSPLWRKISKCWPIMTSSIHEPVATSCDVQLPIVPTRFLWTLSYHNGVNVSGCYGYCEIHVLWGSSDWNKSHGDETRSFTIL